jgi:hypothetical protein
MFLTVVVAIVVLKFRSRTPYHSANVDMASDGADDDIYQL